MLKNKKYQDLLAGILCLLFMPVAGQNPVVPGYFADPSIKKIDSLYYISVTTDGYDNGIGEPMVWVSNDLVNWDIKSLNINDRQFWAPAIEKGRNGKYYMVRQHGIDWTAYIMEADNILGPWKEIAHILDFDVELLTDSLTGEIYGIGSWRHILKFDNNENSPSFMRNIVERIPLKGELSDFTEGPFIFKRNRLYYLMWAGGKCWLETYNVRYATASSLAGPYIDAPNNPILFTDTLAGIFGPGHNSVANINGHYIMFCHRQDKDKYPTCSYRFVCAYELSFNENGLISKVTPLNYLAYFGLSNNKLTNRALGKKVTSNSFLKSFDATNVTDGRNDTRWKAEDGEDKWLTIDLGAEVEFEKVEVDFEYFDKFYLFDITCSADGKNWFDYANYCQVAKKAYINRSTHKWAKARYIKVNVKRSEGSVASIWEIKVWGK